MKAVITVTNSHWHLLRATVKNLSGVKIWIWHWNVSTLRLCWNATPQAALRYSITIERRLSNGMFELTNEKEDDAFFKKIILHIMGLSKYERLHFCLVCFTHIRKAVDWSNYSYLAWWRLSNFPKWFHSANDTGRWKTKLYNNKKRKKKLFSR